MDTPLLPPSVSSRRNFLAAAAAAGTALLPTAVHAAGSDVLKVALVGCGTRGCEAAGNALNADPNVKLWTVCDLFGDRLTAGVNLLKQHYNGRVDVSPARQFTGFNGYKQAIDGGANLVILAASPGFRPAHLAYAVEKGKHVFMEAPHAVDAAGVRSVVESAKLAEKNNLGLCGGLNYRYDPFTRELMKRVRGGAVGDVIAVHTRNLAGECWHRGNRSEWSEMERQVRNWYYYTWLSGDFIVEQAVHGIDKAAWAIGDELPVAATGTGGRQVRTDPKFGNIWDHFSVVYEYASGVEVFLQCRQSAGCALDVNDRVIGTKGSAQLMKHTITTGGTTWRPEGEHKPAQAFPLEFEELIRSIRADKPINDGVRSAYSTLTAIMGREAAYTGQRITWKQIQESKQELLPKELAWGAHPIPPVAMPGKTKFV